MNSKLLELEEEGKIVGVEDTFTAKIYIGTYDTEKDFTRPVAEVKEACQFYVNDTGLCVNVQDTWYAYSDGSGNGGNERGAVVELIQYPRFVKDEDKIVELALELAEILMERTNQKRCSIVTSTTTYTLQNPEHPEVD